MNITWKVIKGVLVAFLITQLEPSNSAPMNLIRPICKTQPTSSGEGHRKKAVLRDAHGSMNLHSSVTNLLNHSRHNSLAHRELFTDLQITIYIQAVSSLTNQHARHVKLCAALGNILQNCIKVGEFFAKGNATLSTVTHSSDSALSRADQTHAMMDAAGPKACLRNFKAFAFAGKNVLNWHNDILKENLYMALGCVRVSKGLHRAHNCNAWGVSRNKNHRLLLERGSIGICFAHKDENLTMARPRSRDPPLTTIDNIMPSATLDAYANVAGITTGDRRLSHGKSRLNFSIKERLEPLGFLLGIAITSNGFHVSSIRRGAVRCLSSKFHVGACTQDFADFGILLIVEAGSFITFTCHTCGIVRKPKVPETLLFGLCHELYKNWSVTPLVSREVFHGLILLRKELLVGVDVLMHKLPHLILERLKLARLHSFCENHLA
mmetsp:Transcript_16210/g.31383  ORF Transcript_16210/g.31383 Transcript_16210/m.31383 type:complete len:436 (-) Transcript_16210:53-1360(-)